jgi:hypothetical protein
MAIFIDNPGADTITMPNGQQIPRITVSTCKLGVKSEKRGMRLTRHFNCTKMAKEWLGLRTRNRDLLIERLEELLAS